MANTRVVALTIPAAKVSGTLADKDVLLVRASFPDEMFDPAGSNAVRTDGGDLRFYTDSAGTTELAREIKAFAHDTSLGADDAVIQVWVKVPSLSSATDTTIYCQYGDDTLTDYAATDPFGRNAVWADAWLVAHLSSLSPIDSSGNETLTVSGSPTLVPGPFGGLALDFSGSDRVSATGSSLVNLPTTHDFTVSFWTKKDNADFGTEIEDAAIAWDGSDDLLLYPNSDAGAGGLRVYWRDLGGNILGETGDLTADWVRNTLTSFAAGDHRTYRNGVQKETSSATGTAGPFSQFYIGGWAGSQHLDGAAAEVRAWKSARSAEWEATEYANQSDPAAFTTVGTPEDVGGGGATYTLEAAQGSYVLTGQAAGLTAARKMAAAVGAFTLTGQDAGLRAGRKITAGAGSYTLTGIAADLKASRKLTAAAGTYALTGYAADLVYTPDGGPTYTLTAGAGEYSYTGFAAGLKAGRKLTAAQGAYTLTGQDAGLYRGYTLSAGAGAYTLTGQAATLKVSRKLTAARGAFAVTGYDVDLDYSNEQIWTVQGATSAAWTISSAASVTWNVQPPMAATWSEED